MTFCLFGFSNLSAQPTFWFYCWCLFCLSQWVPLGHQKVCLISSALGHPFAFSHESWLRLNFDWSAKQNLRASSWACQFDFVTKGKRRSFCNLWFGVATVKEAMGGGSLPGNRTSVKPQNNLPICVVDLIFRYRANRLQWPLDCQLGVHSKVQLEDEGGCSLIAT